MAESQVWGIWSSGACNLGVLELGSTEFGHSQSPVAKKGMILSPERAISGGNFLLVSGPQQFSFGHDFLLKIPKEN